MNQQDDSRQSGQDGAQQQPVGQPPPRESGRQGGGSNSGHASRGPEQEKTESVGQDQPSTTNGQGSNHGSGSNLARSLAGPGNGAIPPDSDRSDSGPSNREGSQRKPGSSPNQ